MATRSTKRKTGRKHIPHRTAWGENVDGLYRCHDGRWRIVATGRKFTEPDERLAVAKFRSLSGAAPVAVLSARIDSLPRASADLGMNLGFPGLVLHAGENKATVEQMVPADLLWAWVREQIIENPKLVAQKVGIEQIGYLDRLTEPEPSPKLAEVGKLYHDKSKITSHWRTKSTTFWDEFCESVDVKTLRELTQQKVSDYKSDVLDAAKSPTYVKHRFAQVKTIIAYGKEWGLWPEDRAKALAYCSVLVPPSTVSIDPDPIDPADFQKLLAEADDTMNAVLLLALNACMYAAEVADVRWPDLDLDKGTLVMDRGKTKVARVAVLWSRTIKALRKLARLTQTPFITSATRQPHNANTLTKEFRKLRDAVKLPDAKFAQVRDGAYTAAVEGEGVQYEHARVLGGHRCGMSDRYIKRRPRLVAGACAAVERAYFSEAASFAASTVYAV